MKKRTEVGLLILLVAVLAVIGLSAVQPVQPVQAEEDACNGEDCWFWHKFPYRIRLPFVSQRLPQWFDRDDDALLGDALVGEK